MTPPNDGRRGRESSGDQRADVHHRRRERQGHGDQRRSGLQDADETGGHTRGGQAQSDTERGEYAPRSDHSHLQGGQRQLGHQPGNEAEMAHSTRHRRSQQARGDDPGSDRTSDRLRGQTDQTHLQAGRQAHAGGAGNHPNQHADQRGSRGGDQSGQRGGNRQSDRRDDLQGGHPASAGRHQQQQHQQHQQQQRHDHGHHPGDQHRGQQSHQQSQQGQQNEQRGHQQNQRQHRGGQGQRHQQQGREGRRPNHQARHETVADERGGHEARGPQPWVQSGHEQAGPDRREGPAFGAAVSRGASRPGARKASEASLPVTEGNREQAEQAQRQRVGGGDDTPRGWRSVPNRSRQQQYSATGQGDEAEDRLSNRQVRTDEDRRRGRARRDDEYRPDQHPEHLAEEGLTGQSRPNR